MKKIYKYATGDVIPEGAVYLGTVTQTEAETVTTWTTGNGAYQSKLVWHYFLVEIKN